MTMLTIDFRMGNEECKTRFEKAINIVPCWRVNEDSTLVAFLEFDGANHSVSSICLHNSKIKHCIKFMTCICDWTADGLKRITKEKWNLHTRRVLDSVTEDRLFDYTFQLNQSNGHLWIIVS